MYTEVVKASYWFPDGASSPTTGSVVPQSSAVLIDSTLFTHLFCAFADLDPQTNSVVVSGAHEQEFSNFTKIVKKKNPHVQTLLSIGGRNADKSAFASMASNPTSRKSFIWSAISSARYYRFDGLDLVWKYPKDDVEMRNFGQLLEQWREAIEDDAERTERMPLLLTAAVYYSPVYDSVSYPIREIKKKLDWVNLIAYDFYSSSTTIGPPAALSDPSNPKGTNISMCVPVGFEKKLILHTLVSGLEVYRLLPKTFCTNITRCVLTRTDQIDHRIYQLKSKIR